MALTEQQLKIKHLESVIRNVDEIQSKYENIVSDQKEVEEEDELVYNSIETLKTDINSKINKLNETVS